MTVIEDFNRAKNNFEAAERGDSPRVHAGAGAVSDELVSVPLSIDMDAISAACEEQSRLLLDEVLANLADIYMLRQEYLEKHREHKLSAIKGHINDFFIHLTHDKIEFMMRFLDTNIDVCRELSCAYAIGYPFREGEASTDGAVIECLPVDQSLVPWTMIGEGSGSLLPTADKRRFPEAFMPSFIRDRAIRLMDHEKAGIEFDAAVRAIGRLSRYPDVKKQLQTFAAKLYLAHIRPEEGPDYFGFFDKLCGGFSKDDKRGAVSAALPFLEYGGTMPEKTREILNQGRTKEIFFPVS